MYNFSPHYQHSKSQTEMVCWIINREPIYKNTHVCLLSIGIEQRQRQRQQRQANRTEKIHNDNPIYENA